MWKWQCTRKTSIYTTAFVFCTLRGETCHLQIITRTVSSDVCRLLFFILFALWQDTLLPFVNLKLIYFVFRSGKTVYCVVLFVSCLFIYNLNELFTFHGKAMPIFIIIYCLKIKFEGNKKDRLPHSFASLLKCYWMSVCGYLLTSGETSQAFLITSSCMWSPPLAFNFKHNTNTVECYFFHLPSRKKEKCILDSSFNYSSWKHTQRTREQMKAFVCCFAHCSSN